LKFIKAIVYSNFWIALGASCFTASTYLMCDLSINYGYLLLVFFATLFAYNYQRLVRINLLFPPLSERQQWIKQHQKILRLTTLIAFAACVYLLLTTFRFSEIWILLPAFALVILYATFLITSQKGLRDLPFIKLFIISAVWVYITVVFPILKTQPEEFSLWIILEKLCFIMALAIPFDIRDVQYDKHTKTLPTLIGITSAKMIALSLLLTSYALQWMFVNTINPIALAAFYAFTALLILNANIHRKELFFSGLLDGVLVVYLLIYL
jgi:4-hydroxybenzoate polyprenyltransferase